MRLSTGASQALPVFCRSRPRPISPSVREGRLLITCGAPSPCRFPRCGPGHAGPHVSARAALDARAFGRGSRIVRRGAFARGLSGSQLVRLGDQIAVLGWRRIFSVVTFRHTAHCGLDRRISCRDQAFLGHVLEQSPQLGSSPALFKPERLGILALAGGNVGGGLDEVEHLLGAGHLPWGSLGWLGHGLVLTHSSCHCEPERRSQSRQSHGTTDSRAAFMDCAGGAEASLQLPTCGSFEMTKVIPSPTGSKAPPGTALETGRGKSDPAQADAPKIQSISEIGHDLCICRRWHPGMTSSHIPRRGNRSGA